VRKIFLTEKMSAQVMADSAVGYSEALAIFDKPLTDIGIKRPKFIDYFPMNDYTTQGVIQFQIPGLGNDYMALTHSYLKIKCKIVNKDGSPIVSWKGDFDGEQAIDENSPLASLRTRRAVPAGKTPQSGGANTQGANAQSGGVNTQGANAQSGGANTQGANAQNGGTNTQGANAQSGGANAQGGESVNSQANAVRGAIPANAGREPTINVAPVNNTLHSIFSRVDVSLQNKVVTESDTNYAYLAYMKALLNTSNAEKEGPMHMQLFYKTDRAPEVLQWILTDDESLQTRGAFFDGSNEVELLGVLYCDVFEINKLILNGVGLGITLYPSTPEFALISEDKPLDVKLVITSACFRLCNAEVSAEMRAAHEEVLKEHPAVYTFMKTELKRFTLPKGLFSTDINDPFGGRVPSELVIGLVRGSAAHGLYDQDPFAFEHFNVSRVQVTADGVDLGEGPIEVKYDDNYSVLSSYLDAYRSLRGCNGLDDEAPFSRLSYIHGKNVLYRFVMNAEMSHSANVDSGVTPLRRVGNVRVSLRFDKELPEATTVIMYAKFPGGVKIDKNRSVTDL
jgi:hypothetical protein